MIISRTPLRISFLGGGTDYQQWYNEHDGAVLATAIDKYCYVMLHDGKSWFSFDVPNKSGLASSSAYTVGLLKVCSSFDNKTIANIAITWERDKTNGNVGVQDQYLCALGGFHLLRFNFRGIRDKIIDGNSLEDYLMLFDTHESRRSMNIVAHQMERVKQNEPLLTRIYEMVDEGYKAILNKDYHLFGELLKENWALKRQLSTDVSTPVIDEIYETGLKNGAIGGKLLGGGGGGFILFLAEPDKQEDIKKSLCDLTYVPFKFEQKGSIVVYRD